MSVNDIITDGTVQYQVKEFISNTDLNNAVNTLNQTVSVIQQDVINLEDKDERKDNTTYALEDIAFFGDLPTGWYLECTMAGTTGNLTLAGGANVTVADLPGTGIYLVYFDRWADTLQLVSNI